MINFPFIRQSKIAIFSRKVILNVFYPFQYTTDAVFSRIFGIGDLINVAGKNKELERQLAEEKIREQSYQMGVLENERLRDLLDFKFSKSYLDLLCAKVIGRSGSNWFGEIIISRGSRDGVKKDCAVIDPRGIVGRVTDVSSFTSKVMLITDPTSSISALDETSRDMGVIVGGAMRPLAMKYVATDAKIDKGDRIVSSGMSEIYPPGTPIGTVNDVNVRDYDIFKKVSVKPAVNFGTLEEVFIILRR